MLKRICLTLLSGTFLLIGVIPAVAASASREVRITAVDGVNVTRWDNLLVVYKGIPSTGQNEWGHNVVVDANGRVTQIIPGGDLAGKDLAIPEGGMVVSATGKKTEWLTDNISKSDYVRFDEVTGRIMVSEADVFDVRFSESKQITSKNSIRYANELVLYDQSGQKTGTNGYGYEIGVNADGMVIFSGGNDNTVPAGGFVLSAIEPEDKLFLKTYGVVGATCKLAKDQKMFTLQYAEKEIRRNAELSIRELETMFAAAETDCLLVDLTKAADALERAKDFLQTEDLTKLDKRTEAYALLDQARQTLCEQKYVEVRGVWYVPLERSEQAVRETVAKMASCGINQLCLGLGGTRTITPVPDGHPFRQNTIYRDADILGYYADACKQAGIELILSLSVFCDNNAKAHKDWMTVATAADAPEAGIFYSPASEAYFEAFSSYVTFLLERYEIDGIQLDYIRYPYFDGSVDYGYDEQSKQAFAAYANVDASVADAIAKDLRAHPLWNQWVSFKRDLITSWVARLETVVHKDHPQVAFSVCLAADTAPDSYFQDGKRWVEEGLVDAVYPMSYAEGIMPSQSSYFSSFDGTYFCIEGSGSYLSFSKQEQRLQVEQTRQYGADGICFFEWGSFLAHGYADYLQNSVFAKQALSPTGNNTQALQACMDSALERICMANARGYLPEEVTRQLAEVLASYTKDGTQKARSILKAYANTGWGKRVYADLSLADKLFCYQEFIRKRTIDPVTSEPDRVPSENDTQATQPATTTSMALPIGLGVGIGAAAAVGVLLTRRTRKNRNEKGKGDSANAT